MTMQQSDPENYRQMSVPHESPEAATAAAEAFIEGLYALRNKHRITEVTLILETHVMRDGEEQLARYAAHFGDQAKMIPLLARTLGNERRKEAEALDRIAKGAV